MGDTPSSEIDQPILHKTHCQCRQLDLRKPDKDTNHPLNMSGHLTNLNQTEHRITHRSVRSNLTACLPQHLQRVHVESRIAGTTIW